jgi:hypothetical protein
VGARRERREFADLPRLDQMTREQVVELAGGVDAATYLVCPDRTSSSS